MFRLYEKMSTETTRNTVAPLYLQVPHPHIQAKQGLKIFGEKNSESSKKKTTCNCFTPRTIYIAFIFYSEKAMATHSSTLAWKIPWTEEPGRL